ncbi:MAG: CPBP family intramembrane metalloprotease [Anaerolineae bacterium]|nr:CPBP family intramembrane metalloprotease [Anaerolineae bacterium]
MNTSPLSTAQIILIAAPLVLFASTYAAFRSAKRWFSPQRAYLLGFVFYWVIWCILLPYLLIGTDGLRQMFTPADQPLGAPAIIGLVALVLPAVGAPFFTGTLGRLKAVTPAILVVSILFALVNGTAEEILWRGTYVSVFPGNWIWGWLYPALGFGLWHLSPQVVFPARSGAWKFAVSAIFLGLAFGWVAYSTGSIVWTTVSHILLYCAGLSGFSLLATADSSK